MNKTFRLSVVLGFLSASNILLVFLYHWYILTVIGPGIETDAFFAGMVVPEIFLMVVTASVPGVLVPFLAVQSTNIQQESWCLLQAIGGFSAVITFVLFTAAPFWVPVIVPGFSDSAQKLTISLARIHLLGMIFAGLNSVLSSYYCARKRFIRAELTPLVSTSIGLFFLLWGLPKFGIVAAAWAMLIRFGLQSFLFIPGLGSYHPLNFNNSNLREVWQRLYPLILGSAYFKADSLIDRFLASMAPAGQLSILFFARQIYTAGNTILGKALTVPATPVLAQSAAEGKWILFKQITRTRVYSLSIITGLVVIGLLFFGKDVFNLSFGRGKFNATEIQTLYFLMIALAGFWVGGAFGQIFSTCFYAKKDTKTPTVIGIIGFTLGIGFKLGGFYLWGVIGIAAGTSLYFLINAGLLRMFLKIPDGR